MSSIKKIDSIKIASIQLKNSLQSALFVVTDPKDAEDFEVKTFQHAALTPRWAMWAKESFVLSCGGWDDPDVQTLACKAGTAFSYSIAILRIGLFASMHYPQLSLTQWTERHVREFLLSVVSNAIPVTQKNRKNQNMVEASILSYSLARQSLNMLSQTAKWHLTGKLSDGLIVRLPENIIEFSVKDYVINHETSYEVWEKGGSLGTVPLPVSMAFLADAISILESDTTQFLIDYFLFQRSEPYPYVPNDLFSLKPLSFVLSGVVRAKNRAPHHVNRDLAFLRLIDKYRETVEFNRTTGLPFSSSKEMSDYIQSVYDACLVIFLTLTGIRISELVTIDDYEMEPDGTWVFKSNLVKTDDGAIHRRTMSGLTAKAAETLCQLSYITKRHRRDGERVSLFAQFHSVNDFTRNDQVREKKTPGDTENKLRDRLNDYYLRFINTQPELKLLWDRVTPHQFRHSFVEFALRRFEGNVFEAIRRHFRHSYGSSYTTDYAFGKLEKEVADELEREFLREIIEKLTRESQMIARDPDFKKDLVGPAARVISKHFRDSSVVTEEEVQNFINNQVGEVERIVAFEYGYCIVLKETASQAKCFDRKTQTPLLKNGSFTLCSDCPNRMTSEQNNKAEITRIAVSHTKMISSHNKIFGENVRSTAIDESKAVVKRATKILKDMGS